MGIRAKLYSTYEADRALGLPNPWNEDSGKGEELKQALKFSGAGHEGTLIMEGYRNLLM